MIIIKNIEIVNLTNIRCCALEVAPHKGAIPLIIRGISGESLNFISNQGNHAGFEIRIAWWIARELRRP
jgi:hypothetical protein